MSDDELNEELRREVLPSMDIPDHWDPKPSPHRLTIHQTAIHECISVLDQKMDYGLREHQRDREAIRSLQAEMIRSRVQKRSVTWKWATTWKWAAMKYILLGLLMAMLGAFGGELGKKLFPRILP